MDVGRQTLFSKKTIDLVNIQLLSSLLCIWFHMLGLFFAWVQGLFSFQWICLIPMKSDHWSHWIWRSLKPFRPFTFASTAHPLVTASLSHSVSRASLFHPKDHPFHYFHYDFPPNIGWLRVETNSLTLSFKYPTWPATFFSSSSHISSQGWLGRQTNLDRSALRCWPMSYMPYMAYMAKSKCHSQVQNLP